MEQFDGDLQVLMRSEPSHGVLINTAFKLAYAVFQECKYIFEKTGLIHEDLKLANVLYCFGGRPFHDTTSEMMTVSIADFGGFVPKNSTRGEATFRITDPRSDLVVNEKHLAYCLAVFIIQASAGSTEFQFAGDIFIPGTPWNNLVNFVQRNTEKDEAGKYLNSDEPMSEEAVRCLTKLFGSKLDKPNGVFQYPQFVPPSDPAYLNSFEKIDTLFMSFFESINYTPPKYPVVHLPEIQKQPTNVGWLEQYGYTDYTESMRVSTTRKNPDGTFIQCRCECGCRGDTSSNDLDVVAPNTAKGRVHEYWAAHNNTNLFFLVCDACAKHFGDKTDHGHFK